MGFFKEKNFHTDKKVKLIFINKNQLEKMASFELTAAFFRARIKMKFVKK